MKRKIRILDTCWHIAHQSDMIKALQKDCDFYSILNSKRQWSERGNLASRPVPENLKFVPFYEPDIYDVAILHVDQQTIEHTHVKRMVYEQLNQIITDIPKIVINHGSPFYPEYLQTAGVDIELAHDECVQIMKELVGENVMVVNSYAAATEKEWGFGVPIVHGIDPDDWLDLPKEPRVFTALSPIGLDQYYNRECMKQVYKELNDKYGYVLWWANVNVHTGISLENYRNILGRSLLYLDTSFRTPMNRARTEAFLSGCCVIQVEGAHDLERWAKNGENIVIVPNNPEEIAKIVVGLLEDGYQRALEIGRRGKEMAKKEFGCERYRKDWIKLLEKVIK